MSECFGAPTAKLEPLLSPLPPGDRSKSLSQAETSFPYLPTSPGWGALNAGAHDVLSLEPATVLVQINKVIK